MRNSLSPDEFSKVYETGVRFKADILMLMFLARGKNEFKFGIAVKRGANAVKRNLIKRRIRSILYEAEKHLVSGGHIVIAVSSDILKVPAVKIRETLYLKLKSAGML
jgi:ribonuclease P protein component